MLLRIARRINGSVAGGPGSRHPRHRDSAGRDQQPEGDERDADDDGGAAAMRESFSTNTASVSRSIQARLTTPVATSTANSAQQ